MYYTSAISSTKLRADDYEKLLESGYTRCGTYIYCRNIERSCCESYQYKVESDEFTPSKNHKKVLKRFHRYLETGLRNLADEEEKK